ncbi:helix-turn-helix domain-containing protein [Pectinatus sottacetonis]|uniref:helix-turn-helix domain-containing protein n=1 Tax=Pectinatus sottacetonis TaxID=1002795 RepID=UPI0018C4C6F9|nr:helix-turn-helix transcriptional regulator [Pectinatus sottacetonis]
MKINYQEIGKRLKTARNNMHMTQQELADHMQVSVSYIKSTERGSKPSLKYLFTVVECCGVSFDWLLTGINIIEKNLQKKTTAELEEEKFFAVLHRIMHDPDPEIRIWAKIQIKRTFPEYFT